MENTSTDWKALCAELLRIADDYHPDRNEDCPLALTQMREAVSELAESLLTHPEPEEPTAEELNTMLYYEFTTSTGHGERIDPIGFARAVLARWGK